MAARRRGLSLRARLVVTAVGVVAAALAAGAFGLVAVLRASLEHGVTNAALTRGADVASLAQAGTLPTSLAFPGEERTVIQVITADGTVIASTANVSGEAALAAQPSRPYTAGDLPIGEQQRFRMTVTAVDTAGGRLTVVSGESLERVDATVRTVRRSLAGGLPVVLLLVAALAWIGSRRALGPVEAIRSEVAEISETDLHRRVPEPNSGDEVAHLARTMNAMLDRLEAASARQSRFVSDASHELRSPLTSLRAVLEIGLNRPHRRDWPERAESALADVDRLEQLVRDLLTLGRATGDGTQRWARCDVAEIVNVETVRCSTQTTVPIVVSGARSALVDGDEGQLGRAVGNLIVNAVRHARTRVDVTVTTTATTVVIDVTDDGPGINGTDRDRIFERFVRLDEARGADDGGSGLGLAIVRAIATAHAGTVSVAGGPPGATFRIALPSAATPSSNPFHDADHHAPTPVSPRSETMSTRLVTPGK